MLKPGVESGTCSLEVIVDCVDKTLRTMVAIDTFNMHFETDEKVNVPIWNTVKIEEEQKTDIENIESWPEEFKVALMEDFCQWFERDWEGNYTGNCHGPLDFYLRKLRDNDEITLDDKREVLSRFIDWIRDISYKYNHYGDYKLKLKTFLESSSVDGFTSSLKDLLEAIANDSIHGDDRQFYYDFEGIETDMWETTQEEEPVWKQNITLNEDKIPFEGIYDIYEEFKDTEDNAWRFKGFSYEDSSVIKTYDTLHNVIQTVSDYGAIAKEADSLRSAVKSYYEVIHSAYKDLVSPTGEIDNSKVSFSPENLTTLNEGISSLSKCKIMEDHLRYWREERGEDVSFPEIFTEESVKHLTGYLGEVMYCSHEETSQDHEVLSNSRESLGWIYKAAQIMIWSITDANYMYSKYELCTRRN
mgnify:CR=1 FL=1